MVTQELLGYIRAEIAKGTTREAIHQTLIKGGGWTEEDLSEAFRTVIPMQNITPAPAASSVSTPAPSLPSSILKTYSPAVSAVKPAPEIHRSSNLWIKILVLLIIVAGIYFSWAYSSQISSFWNALIKNVSSSVSFLNVNQTPNQVIPATNATPTPVVNGIKDCGVGAIPKLNDPTTFSSATLACLGENALNCQNAKGILQDNLFPPIFEITKTATGCNFRISYPGDSTLVSTTGRKLAFKYITCPLNLVKAIDNTNPAVPKFTAPDTTNFSKYASQIYLYATLGIFVENNLDQNKIQALGCSGGYIQAMAESYAKK